MASAIPVGTRLDHRPGHVCLVGVPDLAPLFRIPTRVHYWHLDADGGGELVYYPSARFRSGPGN